MQTPLVSVIIPVHNGEKYIADLIKQILNNPYKNIELIIGNDGSTDRTLDLLNKYSVNSRIKIFNSSENIGTGAIRNHLLKMASGTYLAMQDVDDSFDPLRFVKQVDFLNQNSNVDVVGTGALLLYNESIWGAINVTQKPTFFNWFKQNSMVHASIMFRKSILESGSFFGKDMHFGEDYYFLTQLYWKGYNFANLNENLYLYNISQRELSSRSKKYFFELLDSKIKIATLFPFFLRPFFIWYHFMRLFFGLILILLRTR